MNSAKKMFCIAMILLLFTLTVAGCGGTRKETIKIEPTEIMAWQFAQGLVKPRVPRQNNATFPRYQSSFVERKDNDTFIINAYVNTSDAQGGTISYFFTVEAEYVGNDVFQETSVELRKN